MTARQFMSRLLCATGVHEWDMIEERGPECGDCGRCALMTRKCRLCGAVEEYDHVYGCQWREVTSSRAGGLVG